MKGIENITALNVESLVGEVNGAGNFAPYLDFSNLVSGDSITVNFYMDAQGESSPIIFDSVALTYGDIQDAGEAGQRILPFVIEASQIARVGLTLTSGTVPLSVPWRVTNLGDFS